MKSISFKELGIQDYKKTWASMINYVLSRAQSDIDEVWFLEHKSIFTLGLGATEENILDPGSIPVLRSDRGGQVTYHGPGQLVVYFIINIRRLGWGPKTLISNLEKIVIEVLSDFNILGSREPGKPGVYVEGKKIASIGLKIKRGYSYHGVSLNVDMDLEPFKRINTCGYDSLEVTQMKDHCHISFDEVRSAFKRSIQKNLPLKAA